MQEGTTTFLGRENGKGERLGTLGLPMTPPPHPSGVMLNKALSLGESQSLHFCL